ncbi:cob(I)yrinic acid a,c-diamide adenosyltransferase [Blautia massiliensis (ex Liu et al. 2021)]|uniref:cob(I)yrinic acid a,c-diamide adenosyltransferase n=1 Tax=Blautia massiliensis (ex Liu et al. 2021) TaxID=3062492 RepID=UPI003F8BEB2F
MNIYTKGGDKGMTDLVHTKNVSKSDDRIQLVGTIDELTSHIGLVKTMLNDGDILHFLEKIQKTLIKVMAGVADPYNREYKIHDEKTELLEEEIDRMEGLFNRPKEFILPGACRLSAEIDVARTVARRAERALAAVSVKFGSDTGTKKYMNRLADYLYLLARYADAREQEGRSLSVDSVPGTSVQTEPAVSEEKHPEDPATKVAAEAVRAEHTVTPTETQSSSTGGDTMINEAMIQEVLKRMGIQGRITLDSAKRLIEKIEEEARRRNKPSVIAICGPDGNPIAIHVMDGAFLVSFDVAMKKAYTSVAVKMSTMELSKLAQPGGTFYGLDKMGDGIVIFAGGVLLKVGDTIIGGLGVSGGTGEEDHSLAEYGLQVLKDVL